MKKIFLFMAALAFTVQTFAQDFVIEHLTYSIIDNENKYVAVSSCDYDVEGAITIPGSITNPDDDTDVYTVTAIGKSGIWVKRRLGTKGSVCWPVRKCG